ncbi:unnamed protein product [Durusdinium trenchii]|uniref:Uncharacterized protein n=1 Tax=Durusdinium trenchii TaxID=1381693 RepID=A0ABP0P2X8_9DINO
MVKVCKGFDEDKGRWEVVLENGEAKAVKNDNVLQVLEPGTDILMQNGSVLHVTIGRVSVLNQMEQEDRETWELLQKEVDQFSMTHEVRTELNCPDGWPQFSIVLTGDPSSVMGARKALPEMLKPFGLEIPGPKVKGDTEPEANKVEAEAAETVEVEGLVMKSMERRERPSRKR